MSKRRHLITPLICALAGCVSTDPARDLERSAGLVTERAGVPVVWRIDRSREGSAWDGRAPLSARTAVIAALESNAELGMRIEAIAGARAELARAGLLPNPVVALRYGVPIDGAGGTAFAAALIAQLSDLWLRPARVDAADARLRAKILSTSDAALRLVARVRSAHARLVLQERALRHDEERARHARELDRIAGIAHDAGTTRVDERSRGRALALEAARRLETRRAAVEISRRELLELLGASGAEATFALDAEGSLPDSVEAPPEEELLVIAGSQRLDVRAARAGVEAGDEDVLLASLARIPGVSVRAGAERNLEGREGFFPGGELELPVLDSGSASVARASSRQRAARLRALASLERALLEVRRARVALSEAVEIETGSRAPALELTSANARAARAAFDAGAVSRAAWLRAETDRLEAASELELARAETASRFFELERAAGGRIGLAP